MATPKIALLTEGNCFLIGDPAPRLDGPDTLHHVRERGIEGRAIFRDDQDRDDFLSRLSAVAEVTDLVPYAWALLPNHLHLLVRTGPAPLARASSGVSGGWTAVQALQRDLAAPPAARRPTLRMGAIVTRVGAAVHLVPTALQAGSRCPGVCRAREGMAYLAIDVGGPRRPGWSRLSVSGRPPPRRPPSGAGGPREKGSRVERREEMKEGASPTTHACGSAHAPPRSALDRVSRRRRTPSGQVRRQRKGKEGSP